MEMRLASLTISPNNRLVKYLPLIPMSLGSVNFKVLERTASSRKHNHGLDK